MSSLINFSSLEEVLSTVSEQQKAIFDTLEGMRAEMETLALRTKLEEADNVLEDGLRDHERMIKRLETDAAAIVGVVDELPKLKQEVAARTTQVETKMSMELGEMRETLTERLQAAEKELSAKASSADLRAVSLELEEQAKREEVQRIQEMVERIQRDAVERIDDLSDRTFTLREEMSDRSTELQAESEAMQLRVEARTEAVETKAGQVSMFLVKAEKAIAAKVSTEELERVKRQHEASVEELSSLLLSQMALVHTKAVENERSAAAITTDMSHLLCALRCAPSRC